MSMPRLTLIYAAILIVLGVGSYVLSGAASWTALIPAFFGVIFAICGGVALKWEAARKHVMHLAAALALLMILGTARGVIGTISLVTGAEVERPLAAVVQAISCVLTIGYLAASINSFIQARKQRLAEA